MFTSIHVISRRFKCNNQISIPTIWKQTIEFAKNHSLALRSQENPNKMTENNDLSTEKDDSSSRKKPQFGTRFLKDPQNVFQHNSWDNVAWDEEQEAEAKQKTIEQTQNKVPDDKQEELERDANLYWDKFYTQHQNRFFKDRHWLFIEFPELYSPQGRVSNSSKLDSTKIVSGSLENANFFSHADTTASLETASTLTSGTEPSSVSWNASRILDQGPGNSIVPPHSIPDNLDKLFSYNMCVQEGGYPEKILSETENIMSQTYATGLPVLSQTQAKMFEKNCGDSENHAEQISTFKILEVGCGVGNTVFPVLKTNNDPGLMVYCCDFSSTAVQFVREHPDFDSKRCHAFVWDITDANAVLPFPPASLDIIIFIFVLSSIHPDKMQDAVNRLASFLKPGGHLLLRDYGRYDLAQLRFKNGRCLSENFYVRGDGTRVYFFTQEELRNMFTAAGLEETQNLIDRRLQVNRSRQIKMYRVWIQCKYRKRTD